MTALIIYTIKWAVSLTLLYSLYGLLLRRETFHSLKRSVLVGILILSAVLPCLHLTSSHKNVLAEGFSQVENYVSRIETIPEEEGIEIVLLPDTQEESGFEFSWTRALVVLYIIGVLVCWCSFLRSLTGVVSLIARGRRVPVKDVPAWVHILVSDRVSAPCSWMRWVLSPQGESPVEGAILTHELAHLRLGHSWDMLLCELTCRTLWCLPFVWMLREDLSDVHEFEADRAVLRSGFPQEEYNQLLIYKAAHAGLQPVVNAFDQTQLKKRLRMMYSKKSTRRAMLKVAYIIPLVAFALTAFAQPTWVEEVSHQLQTETGKMSLLSPIALTETLRLTSDAGQAMEETGPAQSETVQEMKPEEELSGEKRLSETMQGIDEQQPTAGNVESGASPLVGTWIKWTNNSSGGIITIHEKKILPNGVFYVQCIHDDGTSHTISSGLWELLDDQHYVEHIEHITTDPSSQGMDNVITYSFADDERQLYLYYIMPGNGVSSSEYWHRSE